MSPNSGVINTILNSGLSIFSYSTQYIVTVDQSEILCYSIPLHHCTTWKLMVHGSFWTSNSKHNSLPEYLEPDLIPDNLISCHLHPCNEKSKWSTEGYYFSPTLYRDVNDFNKVKGSEDSGANWRKMRQEYRHLLSCRRKIIQEKQINTQEYRNNSGKRRGKGQLQFENNHSRSSLRVRGPNKDQQPVSGTIHSHWQRHMTAVAAEVQHLKLM